MVYFLNKIAQKFGYKIMKIEDINYLIKISIKAEKEKMKKDKDENKNSKMNANMIAISNAMTQLKAQNKKLTIANVAKQANVARNTAKKYMYI